MSPKHPRSWRDNHSLPVAGNGAAILFYSTDYDELVGCCDRVLVMYGGAIKRELIGDEITERALVSNALNIGVEVRKTGALQTAST